MLNNQPTGQDTDKPLLRCCCQVSGSQGSLGLGNLEDPRTRSARGFGGMHSGWPGGLLPAGLQPAKPAVPFVQVLAAALRPWLQGPRWWVQVRLDHHLHGTGSPVSHPPLIPQCPGLAPTSCPLHNCKELNGYSEVSLGQGGGKGIFTEWLSAERADSQKRVLKAQVGSLQSPAGVQPQ